MSNFLEVDFTIKLMVKIKTFRPLRGHFLVRVKHYKISINMFLTVKNSLKMLRTLDCNKTSKKNDKNIYEVKKGGLQQFFLKPRPNDRNISTQHITTLLAQHLQAPAKRWQHFSTRIRNTVGRNILRAFGRSLQILGQQCCDMLR